jgi:integrase
MLGEFLRGWHRETMYAAPSDWVFASPKTKGAKPLCGSTASQRYLYPAAVKAGVLKAVHERNAKGKIVRTRHFDANDNPVQRFGWHNLRHSLATWLVSNGVDAKTVSGILRHSNIRTTLGLYSHAVDANKLSAQEQFLNKLFTGASVQ